LKQAELTTRFTPRGNYHDVESIRDNLPLPTQELVDDLAGSYDSTHEEPFMKLIYRGITYDYHPARYTTQSPFQSTCKAESVYELKYRGNTYRIDPNTQRTPVQPMTYELSYRGIAYRVSRDEPGEVTGITLSALPSNNRVSAIAPLFIQRFAKRVFAQKD
jgi:hypothetical protein